MSDSLDQGALIVNLLKAIKVLNPKDEIARSSIASYLYVPDTIAKKGIVRTIGRRLAVRHPINFRIVR